MAIAVVISPIPSMPLDLAAGGVYGPFWGTVYAVLGAEIGAIISFSLARSLGHETIARWFKRSILLCQRCRDRQLMLFVVFARLLPMFSFDIISYGAGLTAMSLRAFALATLLGMIPPTFLFTSMGHAMMTTRWIARSSPVWPWSLLCSGFPIYEYAVGKSAASDDTESLRYRTIRRLSPLPMRQQFLPSRMRRSVLRADE